MEKEGCSTKEPIWLSDIIDDVLLIVKGLTLKQKLFDQLTN